MEPNKLTIALRTSFGTARRVCAGGAPGARSEAQLDVLGRIVGLSRSKHPIQPGARRGISEVELLPQSRLSGETGCITATLELVGFRTTHQPAIRIPRRPLTPGTKVYGSTPPSLTSFYEFSRTRASTSLPSLAEEGGTSSDSLPRPRNTLVTEHLAVLATDRLGKEATVGRVIERLVSQLNASVVVFDPHGEYGKTFRSDANSLQRPARQGQGTLGTGKSSREIRTPCGGCRTAGAASRSGTPQLRASQKVRGEELSASRFS